MPKRAFPRSIVLHPSSLPPDLLAPVCPTPPQRPGGQRGRRQELGLPYFAHRIQFLFCIILLWSLSESGG